MSDEAGGYFIPPELRRLFEEWAIANLQTTDDLGWLCRECGRFWSPAVKMCTCGNPGPMKRPGPTEYK